MAIEIERKFLLAQTPSAEAMLSRAGEELRIEQYYVRISGGTEERIRRTERGGATVFHHTFLTAFRAGVRRVEEDEIPQARYESLVETRDPARCAVRKTRWRFEYAGQLFELDIIHSPQARACCILELQIDAEGREVALPPFLSVVREVTGEPAYSNADISLG